MQASRLAPNATYLFISVMPLTLSCHCTFIIDTLDCDTRSSDTVSFRLYKRVMLIILSRKYVHEDLRYSGPL